MRKECPKCRSKIGIREIVYALPDEPEDDPEFVLGVCCISDRDPTSTCIECGWEGDYEDLARILEA